MGTDYNHPHDGIGRWLIPKYPAKHHLIVKTAPIFCLHIVFPVFRWGANPDTAILCYISHAASCASFARPACPHRHHAGSSPSLPSKTVDLGHQLRFGAAGRVGFGGTAMAS